VRTPWAAALRMLLATSAWGVCSALAAQLGEGLPAGAALLAGGGALSLALVAAVRRSPTRGSWRGRGLVGLFEAVNVVTYVVALHLAPVSVVVPLHLSAPVVLIVVQVARRQRPVDLPVLVQLALVSSAVVLLGPHPGESQGGHPLAGAALALVSAVSVAALVTTINRQGLGTDPFRDGAWQLISATVAGGALGFLGAPPFPQSAVLFLAGVALFGPAFALYRSSVVAMPPLRASLLGLNEALVAVVLASTAFAQPLTPYALLSGVLIAAAVLVESLTGELPRGMRRPVRDPCPRSRPRHQS
jgi:drug/metabolite transporter (DMT)-like permease